MCGNSSRNDVIGFRISSIINFGGRLPEATDFHLNMKVLGTETEWEALLRQSGHKLVILTTSWCGVCKQVIKMMDRQSFESFTTATIDSSLIPKFRSSQGIKSYPTFCLFDDETLVDLVTTSRIERVMEFISEHKLK